LAGHCQPTNHCDNNRYQCFPLASGECHNQANCPDFFTCVSGKCLTKCAENRHCWQGYYCHNGSCLEIPTKNCTSHADCVGGYACVSSQCRTSCSLSGHCQQGFNCDYNRYQCYPS
jgi:hypothetical protein